MTESNPQSEPRPAYLGREVDAAAMKAFAHPLRMAMYEYLGAHGPATATMLARHTGESTGQTSYHLRQLERHGFVEDDPAKGTGRERWWKAIGFSVAANDLRSDASSRVALDLMLDMEIEQRGRDLADWYRRAQDEPTEWVDGSTVSRSTAPMTAGEMSQLREAVMALIHEHTERAKARHHDEQSAGDLRRVRVHFDVLPLPQDQ